MKIKGTVTEVERYQGKGVPTTRTEDSHHLQSPSQQAESFQFVHLFNYFYEKSFKVFGPIQVKHLGLMVWTGRCSAPRGEWGTDLARQPTGYTHSNHHADSCQECQC